MNSLAGWGSVPSLGCCPNRFEVGTFGEVVGHLCRDHPERFRAGFFQLGFELVRAHSAEICARQNGPAGLEAVECHLEKPSVVFLNSKDLSFVVAGEGRGIENDVVKSTALLGESFEPMEGVALAEIVLPNVELVEAKVLLRPVEIDLREIEGGGGCSGTGWCGGLGWGLRLLYYMC